MSAIKLPLEIAGIDRRNLLAALESVRGCLKTTSILWMQALGVPVLNGVVMASWSGAAARATSRFCKAHGFSDLLVRIDKRHDRWTRRRGGYIIRASDAPTLVKELKREHTLALLLEPASPYHDQYSFAGLTVPEESKIIIEVVGPGFDASDILRSDTQPHERWEASLHPSSKLKPITPIQAKRVEMLSPEKYRHTVETRLRKISARIKNPAFPDTAFKHSLDDASAIEEAIGFLRQIHQTALLKHADEYAPVPQKAIFSFAEKVQTLLSGLAGYGIHLGPSSFAASIIPKRGLIFWDFFPARKQEAASLYPAA